MVGAVACCPLATWSKSHHRFYRYVFFFRPGGESMEQELPPLPSSVRVCRSCGVPSTSAQPTHVSTHNSGGDIMHQYP
ncbi:hypothetical protein GDO78_009980 [Eleutherodactylus coqui]|uniref:Uncharacterized protein n=1 Tax=Eleutherodactylus coqui TaxID=57060 RepID=A0A8J6FBK3_ELECQ|nr:hypothetical protein GDO78_009980 [Eleutherodactylus coqui]